MLNLHIFLVGMSGCGKTSLGRKLAYHFNLPFVHMDEEVEKMMGMPISQIKSMLGEGFYQNAQTGVLMALIGEKPSIVSTSSGIALQKENVQLMQNHGLIILISKPLDQILFELTQEDRQQRDRADIVREYDHSIGFYRAYADYTFENDKGEDIGAERINELVKSLSC